MKKTIFLVIALCLLFSPNLRAEHREVAEDGQKVDGSLTYRANLISPDDGDSFTSNDINSYFLIEKKLGLGMDTTFCSKGDYFRIKPFATWKVVDGLNVIGGFSTDSNGSDYIHTGIWYFGSLGKKMKIFLDPRFYFETSADAKSYFDGFIELSYAINDRITLAGNAAYDHWWDSGKNWGLIGPVAYWKLNKSVTIFSRIAKETDFKGKGGTDFRIALKWSF